MDKRVWETCKKWYGDDAYLLAEQTVNWLNSLGHSIELNKMKCLGSGYERLMADGSLQYEIGIRELFENPNSRFSIHEALAPTVACFHEVYGHGGQWRNEAMKDDPLSKVLLLNDLACKSSLQYYGVNSSYEKPSQQYFNQPHEIAAQYMGLKMTQKFLSAIYNKETANELLCEYVNLRIASDNTFIPVPDDYEMEMPDDGRKPYMKPTEPFTTMSQVYDQFQETFVKQVFTPANYKVTRNSMDFVEYYISNQKWPWERIQSRKQVNQISDRLTQAYVLSAVWIEQHEYGSWIKELPVFEHMDFPKNISELIQNIPVDPKEKDLNLEILTEDDIDFIRAVEQIDFNPGQTL